MSLITGIQQAGRYLNQVGRILSMTEGLSASFLLQFTIEELALYLNRLEYTQ